MIKNIIFDFGGVLFDIDFTKSFEAFEKLGFDNVKGMFTQHTADDLFQRLEKGKINAEDFYGELKKLTPNPVTTDQLQNAWNALLLNYRKESLNFLTRLKNHYNLFLLSNTNAIHYAAFSKMLKDEAKQERLEDFFTKAWFSHEIHRRKPDVETFEFVINDAGIKASETLFIDDSFSNLPNAEKAGLKTHLLKPGEKIEELDYSSY